MIRNVIKLLQKSWSGAKTSYQPFLASKLEWYYLFTMELEWYSLLSYRVGMILFDTIWLDCLLHWLTTWCLALMQHSFKVNSPPANWANWVGRPTRFSKGGTLLVCSYSDPQNKCMVHCTLYIAHCTCGTLVCRVLQLLQSCCSYSDPQKQMQRLDAIHNTGKDFFLLKMQFQCGQCVCITVLLPPTFV